MPRRLESGKPGFADAFDRLADEVREAPADVEGTVRAILSDVRRRGDAALVEYTRRFDRLELAASTLRVTEAEIDEAVAAVPPATARRTWCSSSAATSTRPT